VNRTKSIRDTEHRSFTLHRGSDHRVNNLSFIVVFGFFLDGSQFAEEPVVVRIHGVEIVPMIICWSRFERALVKTEVISTGPPITSPVSFILSMTDPTSSATRFA